MTQYSLIRQQIEQLYKTNPHVHLNISLKSPRITLENTEATIKEVYPHLFRIEECITGKSKQHTLKYADIVTKNIAIIELGQSLN